MHQGSSSIKFIKNKKAEHIKNLKEFLLEYEESDLSEEDISDFIYIVQFFEKHTSNVIKNKLSFLAYLIILNSMIELKFF